MKDGLGADLSKRPEKVAEMVKETRKLSKVPCSVKIRIMKDMRTTYDLVQRAERVGAEWITVHGRTPSERRTPVNYEAIKLIKELATVPVFANGDIFSPTDIVNTINETDCDGVMCARGILANPALFAGHEKVPLQCVQRYLQLAMEYGGHFTIHHHHLMYMLFKCISPSDRYVSKRCVSVSFRTLGGRGSQHKVVFISSWPE